MTPAADPWEHLVRDAGGGAEVAVHGQPRARREGLVGLHGRALKIATTAPASEGRATAEIGALLARALGLSPSRVACVAGNGSRQKRYRVAGLSAEDCRARLRRFLA